MPIKSHLCHLFGRILHSQNNNHKACNLYNFCLVWSLQLNNNESFQYDNPLGDGMWKMCYAHSAHLTIRLNRPHQSYVCTSIIQLPSRWVSEWVNENERHRGQKINYNKQILALGSKNVMYNFLITEITMIMTVANFTQKKTNNERPTW